MAESGPLILSAFRVCKGSSYSFSNLADRQMEKENRQSVVYVQNHAYTASYCGDCGIQQSEYCPYFRTLTKSMKFYEVLNNIQLIIHIQADDAVLHDLEQHWTDIKSIGRSEDMVDIRQAKVIDLVETGNISATSEYSAYIDSEALKLDEETDERKVYPYKIRNRVKANGTRYYLNKNYELKDGKRIFEKKSVVYISQYGIDKIGNGIYLDQEDGKNYIVNFL